MLLSGAINLNINEQNAYILTFSITNLSQWSLGTVQCKKNSLALQLKHKNVFCTSVVYITYCIKYTFINAFSIQFSYISNIFPVCVPCSFRALCIMSISTVHQDRVGIFLGHLQWWVLCAYVDTIGHWQKVICPQVFAIGFHHQKHSHIYVVIMSVTLLSVGSVNDYFTMSHFSVFRTGVNICV